MHLEALRRNLTGRIAAVALAAALLGAGAAGAAVGLGGEPDEVTISLASDQESTTTTEAATTTEATTTTGAPTTTEATTTTEAPAEDGAEESEAPDEADGQGPDANGPAKFGLCNAFGSRTEMPGESVAARNLVAAAAAAGQSVEAFCEGATPGGKAGNDDDDVDEETESESTESAPTKKAKGQSGSHGRSGR